MSVIKLVQNLDIWPDLLNDNSYRNEHTELQRLQNGSLSTSCTEGEGGALAARSVVATGRAWGASGRNGRLFYKHQ